MKKFTRNCFLYKNTGIIHRFGLSGDNSTVIEDLEYIMLQRPRWSPFLSMRFGLVWRGPGLEGNTAHCDTYAKFVNPSDEVQMLLWEMVKKNPRMKIPKWVEEPMLAAIHTAQWKEKNK
jgi:hypothetical protein